MERQSRQQYRRKALVIAYHPETMKILKTNLSLGDFNIIGAQNRTEALDKVRTEKPDLVVLDNEIPDAEATELRRVLKESPQTANTPLIVIGLSTNP